MTPTKSRQTAPTREEIVARAQQLWQIAGNPAGRDQEFWLAAENEVGLERGATSAATDAAPPARSIDAVGPSEASGAQLPTARHARARAKLTSALLMLALGVACFPRGLAQTIIPINNASFESPTPSVFPDYTVGATDWTRTRNDVDAGTFAPAVSGVTPAPIMGNQVGFANGSGGLQQVLSATFVAGNSYAFSVFIGFRSDEMNATVGNGAIQLGTFDGTFHLLAAQAGAPTLGQFNFVSGAYQSTGADDGLAIVVRLTNPGGSQVIFDQVQLTATPIPEPATDAAIVAGLAATFAIWRRKKAGRPPA